MPIKNLFGGKALAVALAFAMLPASVAIPQSAPLVGSVIGASEASAQQFRRGGGRNWDRGRGWDRGRHYNRGGYYRGGPRYYHRRGNNTGAAIGGAIAGLAAGAIIAGAANQPRYVERRYVQPAPAYSYRPAPWTQEWYAYCSQRYRSFDARSGTFQPYNGPRRLCQ